MRTLNDLVPGESARVVAIDAEEDIRQRFMDLGLMEGARVEMVLSAPLGDPILVQVMNASLALRRSEAALVLIGDDEGEHRGRHRHRAGRKSEQR